MKRLVGVALLALTLLGPGAVLAEVGDPRNLIDDLSPVAAPPAAKGVESSVGSDGATLAAAAPRGGSVGTASVAPGRKPSRALEKALRARESGNYALALLMLLPLAQQGEPEAEYHLGILYEYGLGVERDDGEAFKWYRRAAERGHAPAQYGLGLMYFDGRGTGSDATAAAEWMARAAEQGYAPAQYGLGLLRFNGVGVERDLVRAQMWFELAAARGNESGRESRDSLVRQLTSEQLLRARQLASLWRPKGRPRP